MRIVIIEDHLMFREVLRKLCQTDLKYTVVGEAGDGVEGLNLVTRLDPDVVLLDLHLPKMDGFDVVEQIRSAKSDVRILVLSSHCDDYTVYRAERANVSGFVDKNSNSLTTLKNAIREVASGGRIYSESFKRLQASRHQDKDSFDKLLGVREREVLAYVGRAWSDEQIAEKLGISALTVATHRKHMVQKLGLAKPADLLRYARDHGFTLGAPDDDGALLP